MDVLEGIHVAGGSGGQELEAVVRGAAGAPAVVVFLKSRPHGPVTALGEYIAAGLEVRGFATVQVNLLTADEQAADDADGRHRLDPEFLEARATAILDWVAAHPALAGRPLGLFADGHAAAAAILGAAARPDRVAAIVCLDGRLDLVERWYPAVRTATLLLVGEDSTHIADLNRHAHLHLAGARLELVPHASHRYVEPRAIAHIAWRSVEWFSHVLLPAPAPRQ